MAAAALALGLIFDYFFFQKQVGISFFIYVCLLLLMLFSLLRAFKVSYNKIALWYIVPIVFFSGMVAVRDSGFLLFWNLIITFGLLLLLSHHLAGRNIKSCLFSDYLKTAFLLPLKILGKSFGSIVKMLAVRKGAIEYRKASQVTKGILITLPIALLFLVLMSSADLAFNHFVSGLFKLNVNLSPDAVAQIWWAVFIAFIWLGAYVYVLENSTSKETAPNPEETSGYVLGNIEGGILFGTLNVLFLAFVLFQIRYLFGGHGAIAALGYTYAEYAHKGFGELVVIALMTFALIFVAEKYIEKKSGAHASRFKILSNCLIVLTLVIMASAFLRLSVYEQAYGFTLLRILVQAFIIWLAAVFLWLGYKIIGGMETRPFIFGIFLSMLAFFAVFNLFNPEAFIARKNIAQFAKSGRLDGTYFYSLSADAAPEISRLLEMPELNDKRGDTLPALAADIFMQMENNQSAHSWQSFNFSRARAEKIIIGLK